MEKFALGAVGHKGPEADPSPVSFLVSDRVPRTHDVGSNETSSNGGETILSTYA